MLVVFCIYCGKKTIALLAMLIYCICDSLTKFLVSESSINKNMLKFNNDILTNNAIFKHNLDGIKK